MSLDIEILGTKLDAIHQAEDRDLFRTLMNELGEPVPESDIIHNLEEAFAFVNRIGYPVIVRPAFTLGGTGGGICENDKELIEIVANGLKASPVTQCLLEKSIAGFKEIEYEVMRDSADNAIVVCNMENIDAVGIHTGDSIVTAPCQTLTDRENQMLRNVSLKIIRALGIEGGCNVQLALDPHSFNYYIIEVNPRVSRSSALASKATGYPIAKLAAKIAVGLTLDEMMNPVTGTTYACFEPSLDYVVTKIPRWPFDKFESAKRNLGTQMKATGEVMAIGRTFEESILKAVRSLEIGQFDLSLKDGSTMTDEWIEKRIRRAGDERLFFIGEAMRRGVTVETLHEWSMIDKFFLRKFENIIKYEELLQQILSIMKHYTMQSEWAFLMWRLQNFGIQKKLNSITYVKNLGLFRFIKKLIHALGNMNLIRLIFTELMKMKMNQFEQIRKVSSSLVLDRYELVKGSNSTMQRYTLFGQFKNRATKRLLLTIIQKQFRRISRYQTNFILNR